MKKGLTLLLLLSPRPMRRRGRAGSTPGNLDRKVARAGAVGPEDRWGSYWLQRSRLTPHRRHFGEVTSQTRHQSP